jgi:hypothetical protein
LEWGLCSRKTSIIFFCFKGPIGWEIFNLEAQSQTTTTTEVAKSSSFLLLNKKSLGLIVLLLGFSAFIIHEVKHRMNDHNYETFLLTEFEGMYFAQPFPMMVFDEFNIPKGVTQNALIVGPGKSGAQKIFLQLEEKHGALNGKSVRLRGTLYTADNKTLIELSEGVDALLAIERGYTYPIQHTAKKTLQLQGEIVNAKCWFTQQETRDGYYHKRCSKNCIENGIPPVLKVKKESGNAFYLLDATTPAGQEAIIKHVARAVEINGKVNFQNGWSVLTINENSISTIN